MLHRWAVTLLTVLMCAVPCRADLPGAGPLTAELAADLEAALKRFGPDYVPRSRFLDDDGSPRYTNRLVLSSSPYLLQHAHNPVNWYPGRMNRMLHGLDYVLGDPVEIVLVPGKKKDSLRPATDLETFIRQLAPQEKKMPGT